MTGPKQVVEEYFHKNEPEGKLHFRGDFECPYKGRNIFGDHDDVIHCVIFEECQLGNLSSSAFNKPLVKNLISPFIGADIFPTACVDPDFREDLYLFGGEDISHTVFIWNETARDLGFNLQPVYSVEKAVLLFDRYTDIISFHELYLKVTLVN